LRDRTPQEPKFPYFGARPNKVGLRATANSPTILEDLRHAITRVLGATWQRCRVHWMRNALAHVPKGQHIVVAAAIRQVNF
jgi:hypothetical protein